MRLDRTALLLAVVGIGACSQPVTPLAATEPSSVSEVPETNVALAASFPVPEPACQEDCGTCVAEFQEWMRTLYDEWDGNRWSLFEQNKPVSLVELAAEQEAAFLPSLAKVIVIDENSVIIGGQADPALGQDQSRFEDDVTSAWSSICPVWVPEATELEDVVVVVHPKAPWGKVRVVVSALERAGADSVVFAFVKASTLSKPPASSVDAEIEQHEAMRSKNYAAILSNPLPRPQSRQLAQFVDCKPAQDALSSVDWNYYEEKKAFYAEKLPKAIAACECHVDMKAWQALSWEASGRRKSNWGRHLGIRIRLTGGKFRKPIRSQDNAPWAEAHRLISNAAGADSAFYLTYPGDKSASSHALPPTRSNECKKYHGD